jgi:hypothetical protein
MGEGAMVELEKDVMVIGEVESDDGVEATLQPQRRHNLQSIESMLSDGSQPWSECQFYTLIIAIRNHYIVDIIFTLPMTAVNMPR